MPQAAAGKKLLERLRKVPGTLLFDYSEGGRHKKPEEAKTLLYNHKLRIGGFFCG